MSLRSGRRGAWLIVAVSVLVLAGCTGGTPVEPETSTPTAAVTPSATPTPTPTETAAMDVTAKPERPAALDEPPSVEGAVAVAEYFLLLYPYVYATGDLAEWNALSEPDCVFCASVVSNASAIFASGHHSEGGQVTVLASQGTEVDPGYWYAVEVQTIENASATVSADGQVVEEFPGDTHITSSVVALWQEGAWSIRGVDAAETAAG